MRRLFSRLFDSGVHVSCSNICVTLSNIPYCLSRSEQPCAAPSPVYRSCIFGGGARQWRCILGRTVAVSLSFSGQPFRLRLRKDNLEFDLDVMTSMCFFHSKSSLTVTPRYLASFTSSSTCPDNSYW